MMEDMGVEVCDDTVAHHRVDYGNTWLYYPIRVPCHRAWKHTRPIMQCIHPPCTVDASQHDAAAAAFRKSSSKLVISQSRQLKLPVCRARKCSLRLHHYSTSTTSTVAVRANVCGFFNAYEGSSLALRIPVLALQTSSDETGRVVGGSTDEYPHVV